MPSGVHAGGQAHHNRSGLLGAVGAGLAQPAYGRRSQVHLLARVEHEVAYPVGEGDGDLSLGLGVAVQPEPTGAVNSLDAVDLLQR